MGKKKVEGEKVVTQEIDMGLSGVSLDVNPQNMPQMHVTPNPEVPEEEKAPKVIQKKEAPELINCLRNERIVVKFVPKESAMIHNKNHILYGGMADTATRNFVVPRLSSTGIYMNPLTKDEKNYLEYVMGLEPNALSIFRKENNFWDDSNPNGIGRVTLHKQDNYLDLSVPTDYIKYKILLLNKDVICPSVQDLEDKPKATYQFVIVSEHAESKSNLSRMDAQMQCWFKFGSVKDDSATLRHIIETVERRPLEPRTKLDFLQCKVSQYIEKDPRGFLRIIDDPYLSTKVLIKKGLEKGVISWRNNLYYWKQDMSPLCEMGEESTLNNAAKYLSSPKHSELKYILEAKVKED